MTESEHTEFDSGETSDDDEAAAEREKDAPKEVRQDTTKMEAANSIILVGATGSGKTTIGWLLARAIGYGFIDLDSYIEAREKKPVARLFADEGEAHFRKLEKAAVQSLVGIKSHVIATGGGSIIQDDNWRMLQEMGTTVWINPPSGEIARRLTADLGQMRQRPLLAELADLTDKGQRLKLLTERLTALVGQRIERYREARVEITDSFSTPESSAGLVKDILVREGILSLPTERRPYDRWHIL